MPRAKPKDERTPAVTISLSDTGKLTRRVNGEKAVAGRAIVRTVSRNKIDYAQIDRVAVGVYELMFNGEKDPFYEPKPGTIMHRIWKGGKLSFRQQRVWKKFVEDLREATGESGKVTSSYEEYSDKSSGGDRVVVSFTNGAYDRVVTLYERFFGKNERILLRDLITDELQRPGFFELERLGLHRNGYKNPDQARASGITNITCLLDRLCDFYHY